MTPTSFWTAARARGALAAASIVIALATATAPIAGWGGDVHRAITGRALDGLSASIRPYFAMKRAFVVEHAVDPDFWRVVDARSELGNEDANHFFHVDGLDGPPADRSIPHDWTAFVAKVGAARANQTGRLPWRAADIYTRLVKAFTDLGHGTGSPDDARFLSAILAHYIEDAHVPFHAVVNSDGQLTNQRGVHSRFETTLVLRHLTDLKLAPVSIRPVGDVAQFVFRTLVESESLAGAVLEADRSAAAGGRTYDDRYYDAFFKNVRPILELRYGGAASAVASVITAAWEAGGSPALGGSRAGPAAAGR